MNRDDFTKTTVDMLGKRVGYLCSNPNCKRPTVGANEINDKSTIIGIAAHITAASKRGPRYDDSLSIEQRRNINNGIWLCSNCANLIDKDKKRYTVELLRDWKKNAEIESWKRLYPVLNNQEINSPYLEADLIYKTGLQRPIAYSTNNPSSIEDGRRIFHMSNHPIKHWSLVWNFNLTIYNNSVSPAFNVKIKNLGEESFTHLDKLPNINNIEPLKNIDLKAKYEINIESDGIEANRIYKSKINGNFDKLKLEISYLDNNRNMHYTYVEFKDDEIQNYK